jgi:beta-barrel assembly-enhancing protease
MAHELGHLKLNHMRRKLVSSTAVWSIVMPMIAADRSSRKIASSGAELFLNSRFSRELEREADSFAHELLIAQNKSPDLLRLALIRLESPSHSRLRTRTYTTTHPASEERYRAAEEAERKAIEQKRLTPAHELAPEEQNIQK